MMAASFDAILAPPRTYSIAGKPSIGCRLPADLGVVDPRLRQ
jgi:hypothetical protein